MIKFFQGICIFENINEILWHLWFLEWHQEVLVGFASCRMTAVERGIRLNGCLSICTPRSICSIFVKAIWSESSWKIDEILVVKSHCDPSTRFFGHNWRIYKKNSHTCLTVKLIKWWHFRCKRWTFKVQLHRDIIMFWPSFNTIIQEQKVGCWMTMFYSWVSTLKLCAAGLNMRVKFPCFRYFSFFAAGKRLSISLSIYTHIWSTDTTLLIGFADIDPPSPDICCSMWWSSPLVLCNNILLVKTACLSLDIFHWNHVSK